MTDDDARERTARIIAELRADIDAWLTPTHPPQTHT